MSESKVSIEALLISAGEIEEDYPAVGDLLRQAVEEIRRMRKALRKIREDMNV